MKVYHVLTYAVPTSPSHDCQNQYPFFFSLAFYRETAHQSRCFLSFLLDAPRAAAPPTEGPPRVFLPLAVVQADIAVMAKAFFALLHGDDLVVQFCGPSALPREPGEVDFASTFPSDVGLTRVVEHRVEHVDLPLQLDSGGGGMYKIGD